MDGVNIDARSVTEPEEGCDAVADLSETHLLDLCSSKGSNEWQDSESDETAYRLHKFAFEGDFKSLSKALSSRDNRVDPRLKDKHGNTALHIASMLGRKECVQVLLAYNAPVDSKNLQAQTSLNEAISYGNREIIMTMLHRLREQTQESVDSHRPGVQQALNDLDDFQLALKWEFHSWVPLVSRLLPCDTCHLYKKGCRIRMDTTLIDFKNMKWERGDLSFIFDGRNLGSRSLLVMDNVAQCYQWIRDQSEEVLAGDVDLLMSTDNETGKLSTRDIKFSRAHSGFIFKEGKSEVVADCNADFYHVHGIKLVSVKRREHLSEEDIKANRVKIDQSNIHKALEDGPAAITRRESLPPPKLPNITWKEYWSAPAGKPPCIGRPPKSKKSSKTFQATVAMSAEFPVTVQQLLTVLESIKPLRHFKKLREFMAGRLPPGFPVKLEIPVFPTVTAKVAFEHFAWKNDLEESFFDVPSHYVEDNNRFAGL
ncbi:ankyrin repeat domain-containing protein 13C-like [Watersipora subatra]|uniref:ankyrin repeat domain-containing protein 13C-like n=1 Tax=Watersipora subatra TaxID=2589382 RepID=UPI00355BDAF9